MRSFEGLDCSCALASAIKFRSSASITSKARRGLSIQYFGDFY